MYSGFDEEMRAHVANNLEGRGIKLHPYTNIVKVCAVIPYSHLINIADDHQVVLCTDNRLHSGNQFVLVLADLNLVCADGGDHHWQLEKVAGGIKATSDKGEEYEADAVMFAVGMMPDSSHIWFDYHHLLCIVSCACLRSVNRHLGQHN
jgi:hypothetical protein